MPMNRPLPTPLPPSDTVRRARVALADDDPDLRILVATSLRRKGFDVIEFENGAQLLEWLGSSYLDREIAPVVVITDIRMPEFDGLQIISGLRRWGWKVPVILMSALEDLDVYDLASRLRVAAYFHKPFDVGHLCRAVASLSGGAP